MIFKIKFTLKYDYIKKKTLSPTFNLSRNSAVKIFYFSFYIMEKTFENWDEENYTLDLSLYDNIDVLAEGLDILEQELFKSLYHSKAFWNTSVAK